jgi:hypothetical protein
MDRFIVRYRGRGPRPDDAVSRLASITGARLVEDTGRMMLVDADESPLREVFSDESQWVVAKEILYPRPNPGPRVERPAK